MLCCRLSVDLASRLIRKPLLTLERRLFASVSVTQHTCLTLSIERDAHIDIAVYTHLALAPCG